MKQAGRFCRALAASGRPGLAGCPAAGRLLGRALRTAAAVARLGSPRGLRARSGRLTCAGHALRRLGWPLSHGSSPRAQRKGPSIRSYLRPYAHAPTRPHAHTPHTPASCRAEPIQPDSSRGLERPFGKMTLRGCCRAPELPGGTPEHRATANAWGCIYRREWEHAGATPPARNGLAMRFGLGGSGISRSSRRPGIGGRDRRSGDERAPAPISTVICPPASSHSHQTEPLNLLSRR